VTDARSRLNSGPRAAPGWPLRCSSRSRQVSFPAPGSGRRTPPGTAVVQPPHRRSSGSRVDAGQARPRSPARRPRRHDLGPLSRARAPANPTRRAPNHSPHRRAGPGRRPLPRPGPWSGTAPASGRPAPAGPPGRQAAPGTRPVGPSKTRCQHCAGQPDLGPPPGRAQKIPGHCRPAPDRHELASFITHDPGTVAGRASMNEQWCHPTGTSLGPDGRPGAAGREGKPDGVHGGQPGPGSTPGKGVPVYPTRHSVTGSSYSPSATSAAAEPARHLRRAWPRRRRQAGWRLGPASRTAGPAASSHGHAGRWIFAPGVAIWPASPECGGGAVGPAIAASVRARDGHRAAGPRTPACAGRGRGSRPGSGRRLARHLAAGRVHPPGAPD